MFLLADNKKVQKSKRLGVFHPKTSSKKIRLCSIAKLFLNCNN